MTGSLVYVAIDKESGEVVLGARGQAGFSDTGSLNKSIAQRYRSRNSYGRIDTAKTVGKKASDYYDIKCIDMNNIK